MKSKMKFFAMQSFLVFLLAAFTFSCNSNSQNQENEDTTAMEMTEGETMASSEEMPEAMKPSESQNTKMEKDQIDNNVYYPDAYTYVYWDTKRNEPMKVKASNKSSESAEAEKIYTDMSKLDRAPLFSANCTQEKDPEKCSNEAIQDYIRKNAKYPNEALRKDEEGLQYVTFIITENGEVEEADIKVESKGETCADCASEAKRLVAEMPTWQPASRNGKPVNVQVVLPVRFDQIFQ